MEYDTKEFNKDELLFLRSNTILGPIAKLKIMKISDDIEKFRNWYLKLEGELIDYDYSVALQFEYELRLRVWQNKCSGLWKKYGDGTSLEDFSFVIMRQNMAKNASKIKNRK